MKKVTGKKYVTFEELEDKKVSIAIMSSTVILTIQYFFLVSFNLLDTSKGSILQIMSKVIVAIIFVYVFPSVYKNNKNKIFVVYFIAIFIILSHYLFFSRNREYMIDLLFPLIFMCLPVFLYALSLKNWSVFKEVMRKASLIVFFCGFILSLMIFSGLAKIDSYSMAFSYYMLLPAIIFIDELFDFLSLKAIFISSFSVLSILAIGSRGALLCIVVFIVLKLLTPFSTRQKSNNRIFIILLFVLLSTLIMINLQSILLVLYSLFYQWGLNSRSIILLLSGEVYLSGRELIYEKIMSEIVKHPYFGLGIAGDRLVLNGTYSHNIFLEILLNYGVITGGIIILILLSMIVSIFFVKNMEIYNLLIIWISLGFVSLFVSGSYLTDLGFWTLLGLLINAFFFKEKELLEKK